MSLDKTDKINKGGNYKGRKFALEGWTLDPSVTSFTSRPWFNGKPCKRCGSTVRFEGPVKQCVRCLKQWRKENRHKWPRKVKPYDLRANPLYKSHKLNVDRYNEILALQGGVCAICKEPETMRKQRLSVDHDHKTHTFRGLLCNACNRGLGLFRDNPEALKEAAKYLLENPWKC